MARQNNSGEEQGRNGASAGTVQDPMQRGGSDTDTSRAIDSGTQGSAYRLERGGMPTAHPVSDTGNDVPAELARKLLTPTIQNHGCPGDPLWQQFPQLGAMLFRGSWNGIMPRKPAMLTIVVRPTGLQFTLRMPTEGKQVRDNVSYFADLLPRIEQCLVDMVGDWSDLTNGPGATYKREQRKKLLAKSDSPI